MLKTVLGALFGAIVNGLVALFGKRQERADHIEQGQNRQTIAQHEKAAEATKAMQAAAAEPRDADTTQGRLKDGSF